MYFCQPNKTAFNSYNYIFTLLNTIEIIIISFNIPHFPGGGHDWIVVHFIDWQSFNFKVTCQPFDQSHRAIYIKWTHNVILWI